MNQIEHGYTTRAIEHYGVSLSSNVLWFIDEGKVYYAVHKDGKVVHFISGYVTGRCYVMDYSSQDGNIDSLYWKDYLSDHFDLKIIDTRH